MGRTVDDALTKVFSDSESSDHPEHTAFKTNDSYLKSHWFVSIHYFFAIRNHQSQYEITQLQKISIS